MQGDAKKQIRNVGLFAHSPPSPMPGVNGRSGYTGKMREYFEGPTTDFVWQNAKYASNYYKAQVQGVIPGTFETERGAYIRSQDIVEQTTGAKMPNDYQCIYFQDTRIKGLYTGAKVKYAGNTWLAISPFNISDPLMQAVVRRCNAVWKHLDYYGNVIAEPFVFHDGRASATANEYLDWDVIPNWYQKCVMQLNDETRELAYNRRIVLGSSVVEVRGLVDFISDFSGTDREGHENPEPSHVMFFDVQFQQPTENDDMERGIAGGKAFRWDIRLSFAPSMGTGETQQIIAESVRNGDKPDTDAHPVSYLYSVDNSAVAAIGTDGTVTALSEGTATITVALEQNPAITATAEITVTNEETAKEIVFTPDVPTSMKQMQTYEGTAKVMKGAEETGDTLTMTVYGAMNEAEAAFDSGTGKLTITCYEPSDVPLSLVFKASDGTTATRTIQLEGY